MVFVVGLNIIFSCPVFDISVGYVFFATFVSLFGVLVIDALTAFLTHKLPKKWVDPFKKNFQVSKGEKNFYEKLGVRKFKDLLPDGGVFVNFKKSKVENKESIEYVEKYLLESTYGEVDHIVSIFTGFLIILFFPIKFVFCFGLPIAIANIVLNYMPIMALRYNRYKLFILHKRLARTDNLKTERKNNDNNISNQTN